MERRQLDCGLTVDVAVTEEQWQTGLSGITEWGDLDGMLFVFPVSKRWPVYMHEMSCSLTAYWFNDRQQLVAMTWMPQLSTVYYLPILDARYLLETRSPMPWAIGEMVNLEAVHDALGHANAHSSEAERVHNGPAVLDDESYR